MKKTEKPVRPDLRLFSLEQVVVALKEAKAPVNFETLKADLARAVGTTDDSFMYTDVYDFLVGNGIPKTTVAEEFRRAILAGPSVGAVELSDERFDKKVEHGNKVALALQTVVGSLFDRWQDERAYEDFNEYVEVVRKKLAEVEPKAKLVRMGHTPSFSLTLLVDRLHFLVTVTSKDYTVRLLDM